MTHPGPAATAAGDEAGVFAAMSAADAASLIAEGSLSSEELVGLCLRRISEVDGIVEAWTHFDPEYALAQAREADSARQAGRVCGPLHGIPVGVKDIFDTKDMPTEDGSVLHAGRQPTQDATVVSRLRAAGAIIMGKTVTTEFATYSPGKTRNPHDSTRTPGGSSSGSAAAVASGMVPLAIGSQTNGSVIRPASFCGIHGYKPSHGLISRHRVLALSRVLDHVGVFGRSITDIAVLAEQLMGFDPNDPDTRPRASPRLTAVAAEEPPVPPRIGFARTPVWDQADEATREGFAELVDHLGEHVTEVAMASVFDRAVDWHGIIMETDLARFLARDYDTGKDRMSDRLRTMIESGQKHLAVDYMHAVEMVEVLNGLLAETFADFDAIITPAVPGEAPVGLESTGSPIFCSIWSLCGTPAITLPLMQGEHGLPIGIQVVGARGDDARLLRTARWLESAVAEEN